jgi:hypothetical protein
MSSGTSYNGWPANSDRSAIGVVPNEWFPGGVKSGDVSTVLSYLATEFNARVEPIVAGWCWGYTYKANVNNPSQLSCHASGTAIDINAPDHPNGVGGTFSSAQRGTIYQILDEVRGSVSWLEGYDEMHFEICVNAADLATVAAGLPGGGQQPDGADDMPLTDADAELVADKVWARLLESKVTGGFVSASELLLYLDQHTQPAGLAQTIWNYLVSSRVVFDGEGNATQVGIGDMITYIDQHTQ